MSDSNQITSGLQHIRRGKGKIFIKNDGSDIKSNEELKVRTSPIKEIIDHLKQNGEIIYVMIEDTEYELGEYDPFIEYGGVIIKMGSDVLLEGQFSIILHTGFAYNFPKASVSAINTSLIFDADKQRMQKHIDISNRIFKIQEEKGYLKLDDLKREYNLQFNEDLE